MRSLFLRIDVFLGAKREFLFWQSNVRKWCQCDEVTRTQFSTFIFLWSNKLLVWETEAERVLLNWKKKDDFVSDSLVLTKNFYFISNFILSLIFLISMKNKSFQSLKILNKLGEKTLLSRQFILLFQSSLFFIWIF